ncbi:ABC-type maltose transport system permease subunit [Trueperella bonasi]|uniref:ABC-type maltose transport system permease subunit n=1 Tax=Trueperella bonasi TaxID=312286 RepID=A0ABT9NH87_9ACTO|nr:ABC-type maltose transport system permease subunit [Trueperella bonasi]
MTQVHEVSSGQLDVRANKIPFSRWFRELGFRHVVAILAAAYAAFPILYILSAALNPSISTTLTGVNEMFAEVSTQNFSELNGTMFWTCLKNTLIIGVATAVGTVLMGAAAAYAFSRYRF